jgi:hypothetical protein
MLRSRPHSTGCKKKEARLADLSLYSRSSDPDLNEGPVDLQSTALTPELPEQDVTFFR